MSSKFGLGKGLNALLPENATSIVNPKHEGDLESGIKKVSISRISPNASQPRKVFNEESINELSQSIKRHGVIQPLVVESNGNDSYTIVAGERRWRAAKLAGLTELPVIVREFGKEERLEIALVENVQREDLNPVDEAEAYRQLMEATGLTQEEIASRVGKSRSAVANSLRLLGLPTDAMEALRSKTISAGHARAILSAVNPADRSVLLEKILKDGISVREAEAVVSSFNNGSDFMKTAKVVKVAAETVAPKKDPELFNLEQNLIGKLGTKVVINGNATKGKIEIDYFSLDDLNRIYEIISGESL